MLFEEAHEFAHAFQSPPIYVFGFARGLPQLTDLALLAPSLRLTRVAWFGSHVICSAFFTFGSTVRSCFGRALLLGRGLGGRLRRAELLLLLRAFTLRLRLFGRLLLGRRHPLVGDGLLLRVHLILAIAALLCHGFTVAVLRLALETQAVFGRRLRLGRLELVVI